MCVCAYVCVCVGDWNMFFFLYIYFIFTPNKFNTFFHSLGKINEKKKRIVKKEIKIIMIKLNAM